MQKNCISIWKITIIHTLLLATLESKATTAWLIDIKTFFICLFHWFLLFWNLHSRIDSYFSEHFLHWFLQPYANSIQSLHKIQIYLIFFWPRFWAKFICVKVKFQIFIVLNKVCHAPLSDLHIHWIFFRSERPTRYHAPSINSKCYICHFDSWNNKIQ